MHKLKSTCYVVEFRSLYCKLICVTQSLFHNLKRSLNDVHVTANNKDHYCYLRASIIQLLFMDII